MPVRGIGCDILRMTRLDELGVRRGGLTRLATRVLTTWEHQLYSRLLPSEQKRFLAVRCVLSPGAPLITLTPLTESWVAKEALYKALYPMKLRWKDISVLPGSGTLHPKPFLQASETALAGLKRPKFHLSISHDAGLVVAMVVVEDTL